MIRSLHLQSMRNEDLHGGHDEHALFQASTVSALLDGAYDGDLTFADLASQGDTGLGTLNGLDGEMIAVDSVVAIAEKVAAGEISQAAADEALRLLSSPGTGTVSPTAAGAGGEPDPTAELIAAEADADAALAVLCDRGR